MQRNDKKMNAEYLKVSGMSLVVYSSNNNIPHDSEVNVVLNNPNNNAVVLFNKNSNEISLIRTLPPVGASCIVPYNGEAGYQSSVSHEHAHDHLRCPHCGSIISESNSDHNGRTDRTNLDTSEFISTPFMDTNYFRILSSTSNHSSDDDCNSKSSISSGWNDTKHLNESLFTQGYFDKFFKEISLVGRGANSTVYKVEHTLNGISLGVFGLKKITIGDNLDWLSKVLKEVTLLCNISSNNSHLVNYNHVWLEVDSINKFGPKVPCAFILQQFYSGGNLEDFVLGLKTPSLTRSEYKKWKLEQNKQRRRGGQSLDSLPGRLLTNEELLHMFTDIVIGVHQLHKNHIIHRDLKPSNFLLASPYLNDAYNLEPDMDSIPQVLVGDFGESQIEGEKRDATGATGTIEYTAPELLNNWSLHDISEFNKKTDTYALGLILYFMCFGELPFENKLKGDNNDDDNNNNDNSYNGINTNMKMLREEIQNLHIDKDKLKAYRDDLDPMFYELILNLTSKIPERRFDTADILKFLKAMNVDGPNPNLQDALRREFNEKNELLDTIDEVSKGFRRLSITDAETEGGISNKFYKRLIDLCLELLLLKLISAFKIPYLNNALIFFIGLSFGYDYSFNYTSTCILLLVEVILFTWTHYSTRYVQFISN